MRNNPLMKTYVVGALVMLMIAGISWFLIISPRLNEPARLALDAESALAQGQSLVLQAQRLEGYERDVARAEEAAAELGSRFTATPDIPYLIEQIEGAATRAGMQTSQIISVVPSKPTLIVVEAAPVDPNAAAPADPNAAPADPNAAPADPNAAPVDPAAAAPAPAITLQTARMDVAITVQGTFRQVQTFLVELQRSTRVIVVDSARYSLDPVETPAQSDEVLIGPDGQPLEPVVVAPSEPTYTVSIMSHVIMIPELLSYDGSGSNQQPADPNSLIDYGDVEIQETDPIESLPMEEPVLPENDPILNPEPDSEEIPVPTETALVVEPSELPAPEDDPLLQAPADEEQATPTPVVSPSPTSLQNTGPVESGDIENTPNNP